jgi:hypothetical protein
VCDVAFVCFGDPGDERATPAGVSGKGRHQPVIIAK